MQVSTGMANNMARSAQPLILKNELSFGEAAMGRVMSAQFAFGGFANGFLLSLITRLLGGKVCNSAGVAARSTGVAAHNAGVAGSTQRRCGSAQHSEHTACQT